MWRVNVGRRHRSASSIQAAAAGQKEDYHERQMLTRPNCSQSIKSLQSLGQETTNARPTDRFNTPRGGREVRMGGLGAWSNVNELIWGHAHQRNFDVHQRGVGGAKVSINVSRPFEIRHLTSSSEEEPG